MLKELGSYKQKILSILRSSADIKELLLDGGYMSEGYANPETAPDTNTESELDSVLLPYHYVDGIVTEPKSYIFVEVYIPKVGPATKMCKIVVEFLCHRDLVPCSKPGYSGTRADILAQVAESLLLDKDKGSREFGIGRLTLEEAGVISSKAYCGRSLTFTVPNFR